MRVSTCLTATLIGVSMMSIQPPGARAEGDQAWQTCVSSPTAPDVKVTSCSEIIEARRETGKRLAAAYCFRGHFDLAIKHNPQLSIAYGNRGFAYFRKRDLTRAIADYTTQIKLRPDVLAYINRGNAYRDGEQLDRAAADYGEVIKLAPTDARGWRNRGMIKLFQGDSRGGIADYDKALQYDPADAYSWNNRGQAKMRLGDKPGAIADFRRALDISPGLRTASESLQRLGAAQ